MVTVMGTVQIGNPVGQPQIIPIPGNLQQNEKLRCLYKKLRVQTYLQTLGAVSAVQQVWYDLKDVSCCCLKRGPSECKTAQSFQFLPKVSECNQH